MSELTVGQRVIVVDVPPLNGCTGTVTREQRGRNLLVRLDDSRQARGFLGDRLECGVGPAELKALPSPAPNRSGMTRPS